MIGMKLMARRLFSERQIVIRSKGRIRYVTLSRPWIIAGTCAALLGSSAMAKLVVDYVNNGRKIARKEAQVEQAETSNSDLRDLVNQLRARLATATAQNEALRGDLYAIETRLREIDASQLTAQAESDAARARLKVAQAALDAKTAEIHGLEATKSDLTQQTAEQSAALNDKLRALETELQDAKNQAAQYKTSWESAETKVQQGAAEREKVVAERDGLLGRIAVLQQPQDKGRPFRMAEATPVGVPQAGTPQAAARGTDGTFGYLANETRLGWTEVASLLSSAGVDLDKLATRMGAVPAGEGGPFVALGSIKQARPDAGPMSPEMQKLLKTLPLSAPLNQFTFESPFGVRVDPFNRRTAMHTGVDLAAAFRSPVYNTAPGIVTFAGPHGEYGKMVEIDHGFGIVTRYAHLHRVLVAKGQRITGRQEIGQLGSSGRSTGPHVHYEVVVNGTPQDPAKFLQAGKSVVVEAAVK
ncbi:MAG: peptidoglycan DD-metalloendopeptidase family protein [Alphaproteobacteria bacterium]|nr:peptidoglycan DD-metalloendopeptidase family protein [Alphaproteobacteria bacterium]